MPDNRAETGYVLQYSIAFSTFPDLKYYPEQLDRMIVITSLILTQDVPLGFLENLITVPTSTQMVVAGTYTPLLSLDGIMY